MMLGRRSGLVGADDTVARAARSIKSRGLAGPAIVALEMLRPVGFVLGQFMSMGRPLLGSGVERWAGLFADRDRLERLRATLLAGREDGD